MDELKPDELPPDDELDSLVRKWARANQPSDARLEQLAGEICRRAQEPASAMVSVPSRSRASVWALVASVAACAALVGVYIGGLTRSPAPADNAALAEAAAIQWDGLRLLASESGRLFDHRLAWLAETNQELRLGLDSEETGESGAKQTGPQIVVRVVVFHRNTRADAWQMVYSTNIVTKAEEVVQVASDKQGSQLRLWSHVLPDKSVAVDTDLSLGPGTAPHWTTTSVLSGAAAPVVQEDGRDGEYQVWQSAAVLEDNAL